MMAPQAEGEHLTIPFDDMAFVARTTQLAREAGDIARAYFRRGERTTAAVEHKEGGSPVTEADRRVDDFLRARLPLLEADAGWLSEETIDDRERLSRRRVFVVDPIDGTRAFMAGDPRWGVCIALVEAGRPVVGVVHMPALEATYVAAVGRGALLNGAPMAVAVRQAIDNALIAGPPSILRALAADGLPFQTEPRIPSLAYRLVRVAEGTLDIGIASTNACDWDIAAADIIIEESGGKLLDTEGRSPVYNRSETRHGVLCAAPARLQPDISRALRRALAGTTA